MEYEDFNMKMGQAFSPKKDPEKKKDFSDMIFTFSKMCPEQHLQSVYNHFFSSKEYPSRKNLFKFAREAGYIKEQEFKPKGGLYFYRCNGFYKKIDKKRVKIGCRTDYSISSGGCPNCGSTSGTIVVAAGDFLPGGAKIVKRDCFRCKLYFPEDGKKVLYLSGPECSEHGGRQSPSTDQVCKTCKCKPCCVDSRNFEFENYKYMESVRDPDRGDMQPWLRNSCKPGDMIFDLDKLILKTIKRG